ncbi:MAG: RNA-binding domain-containing protein [Candidatus Omnitrophota bacterium]
MKPRVLFSTIFGKESNITELDIREKILGILKENSYFECKNVIGKKKGSKLDVGNVTEAATNTESKPRDDIMKELVAFLNKIDSQGGILALGINAKDKVPTDIPGVDEVFIKSEVSLQDWIIYDIGSIPQYLELPSIEIEKINGQDKNTFLVEIHPRDTNVVYYSKRDNKVYKREADETKEISLVETIRLVEEKRVAKVFVNLVNKGLAEKEGIIEASIGIVYKNFGSRPAFHGMAMLLFDASEKGNCEITLLSNDYLDISHHNVCFKCYQRHFPNILYPERNIADLTVKLKFKQSAVINLSVDFDEEKGRSQQIFEINKDGAKEISKNYRSYI